MKAPGFKSLRESLEKSAEFGGSPLLQRCGNELDFDYALGAGLENPGL
jgi:hypothetical protein